MTITGGPAAVPLAGEGTPLLGLSNGTRTETIIGKAVPQKRVSFEWGAVQNSTNLMGADHDEGTSWRIDEDSTRSASFPSTPYNSLRSSLLQSSSSIWNRYTVTTSERQRALQKPGVGAAAFLIRGAVLGQVENPAEGAYDPYDKPNEAFKNTTAVVCGRACANRWLVRVLTATAWILVLTSFVEPPHWCCDKGTDAQQSATQYEGCLAYFAAEGIPAVSNTTLEVNGNNDNRDYVSATTVQYYPNSSSVLLTGTQSNYVEAACVAIIGIFLLLRYGRDGLSIARYLRPGSSRWPRITQLICMVFLVGGLIANYKPHHPLIRLILLASVLPATQRDLHVFVNMIPKVLDVLALLFVLMVFYAWFGAVIFVDTAQGADSFSSFLEAMWTLWICVTTANYPDVMMPSYNENRWSALYFLSFMVITFFFLMNLILAAVVDEHERAEIERTQQHQKDATVNLKGAYELMDYADTGRIDRDTILALFTILNTDFPEFRTLTDDDTKLLFAILDKDGSSTITEDEFMDFGNVLLLEFVKTSEYATLVELHFPVFFRSQGYQRFCRMVRSNMFEYAIDGVLLMNAIVIGIQSFPELSGQKVDLDPKYWDGSIDTIWEYMETAFAIVYCVEVIVKIVVAGWKSYSESQRNMFDFFITLLAVLSMAYVYYPNDFSDTRLIRLIVMARVLRLVRLLTMMKRFQLIAMVSVEILPEAASVVQILFFVMYVFSALGLQLYGGLITRDPSNPLAYLILGTDFSDNEYWANNFNDMVSGMNVLFNLLVINNWTECEVGFEAVTQAKWVRYFFLLFHLIGVVLVNNLVIAFIINSFLRQMAIFNEKVQDEVVGDGEAVIQNRRAVFDASTVTGTKTSLSGGYIARLRKMHSDPLQGREQERLRRLFTHHSSNEMDVNSGEAPST